DVADDRGRALLDQRLGRVAERSSGVDDVIHENTGLPGDLADHVHDFGFAGALAALVDDGERCVDTLGETAGTHNAADIGRDYRDVSVRIAAADIAHHDRRGEQIVGRNVEKALNLARME